VCLSLSCEGLIFQDVQVRVNDPCDQFRCTDKDRSEQSFQHSTCLYGVGNDHAGCRARSFAEPSQNPQLNAELREKLRKTSCVDREVGDQGDGAYVNPILPGDFSDSDVIRVGGTFYMISSTMQYSPGMAVLASRDMVNWKMIGHVVQDLSAIDPALNWDQMNRPGDGMWAGSIRFQSDRFWVYFGTPDQEFT
jgi:Glycosyl hydrolases family 43